MNKKIIIPLLAFSIIAIIGSLMIGIRNTEAANQPSTMIERLAEKLGVDKTKLQSAFNESRSERQKEMQTEKDAKLNDAVSARIITEDQKNKIIEKRNSFRAEGRGQRQAHREEMEKWMAEQGIDHDKLEPYMQGNKESIKGMGNCPHSDTTTAQSS